MLHKESSAFRADLQGLRGIAVLAVVIYDTWQDVLPGGFGGVDVFYVLSGYFISGMLFRELERTGTIALGAFWARRVRRILPSASLVLIVTALAAWLFVETYDLRRVGQHIAASGAFAINWLLAFQAVNYLVPTRQPSIVQHYWSLAVEEQFYIAWPLLLFGVSALSRRTRAFSDVYTGVWLLIAILWGISFGASLYLTALSEPHAFFGTVTRGWQLLTGAAAALLLPRAAGWNPILQAIARVAGVAGIGISFAFISSDMAYPGWIALLPTVSTALLVGIPARESVRWSPDRLLEAKPLVFIGAVSFVWYLWQWPFLYFGKLIFGEANLGVSLIAAALSLLAASLTHYLFENPIRFSPRLVASTRLSLSLGAVLTLVSISAGVMVYFHSRSIPIVLSSGMSISLDAVENDVAGVYENGCHLKPREWIYGDCSFGQAKASKTVVLFGDSHAAQYFPALEAAARKSGWKFLSRTKSACPSIATAMWNERYLRQYYECDKWRDAVLAELERIRPQLVILANSLRLPPLDRGGVGPAKRALWHDLYLAGEKEMAEKLFAVSERIVYLRDMKFLPEPPARCLLRNPKRESSCSWTIDTLRAAELYPLNDRVGLPPRATIIDFTDIVCPGGRCPAVHDGAVLMYDNQHFTASYARQLTPQFEMLLE